MEVPFYDLLRQEGEVIQHTEPAIMEVIRSGEYIYSPVIYAFENELAKYFDVDYAVAVASGTDALTLALTAAGIGPVDEVITTTFSFYSTAAAIVHAGATPVFTDVDPATFNIQVDRLEAKITERTRAILPVHLFGQAADMSAIRSLAAEYDLAVIEDAAQAAGATHHRERVGGIGLAGCISFNCSKNLGAYGNGGAILSSNRQVADEARILRNYGLDGYFHHTRLGLNSNLSAIQAAALLVKLRSVDDWNRTRRRIANHYGQFLGDIQEISAPVAARGNTHVYHKYTVIAERRDDLQRHLASKGVESKVFYPEPLHMQPCFRSYVRDLDTFPVADDLVSNVLSLPIYPGLLDEEVEYVAKCIREFYRYS